MKALEREVARLGLEMLIKCCPVLTRECLRATCRRCDDSMILRNLETLSGNVIRDGKAEDFLFGLRHGWKGRLIRCCTRHG